MSKFDLNIEFFIFFLKFSLVSRTIETSKILVPGGRADIFFRNRPPPICITIDVHVIAHFP